MHTILTKKTEFSLIKTISTSQCSFQFFPNVFAAWCSVPRN